MEDQHGALLDGQPPEGTLELVSVVDGRVLVGPVHGLDLQEPDPFRPLPATPGLGVAGIGQDPVEPGLEAFGVPRARRSRHAASSAY